MLQLSRGREFCLEAGHFPLTGRVVCAHSSKPLGFGHATVAGMTPPSTIPKIRAQPLVSVSDVERAADWYCHVLGAVSGHGEASTSNFSSTEF